MRRHILVVISMVTKVLDALCVFVLVCNDFARIQTHYLPIRRRDFDLPPIDETPQRCNYYFCKSNHIQEHPQTKVALQIGHIHR